MINLLLVYLLPLLMTCSQHSNALSTQFRVPGDMSNFKNLPCPNPEDIQPCICTYVEDDGSMDMDCSTIGDEQELYDVFHANIPFLKFRKLMLGCNNLKTLSDTVFGDVMFEDVVAGTGGTLTSIGSKTFMKSASTLWRLFMHSNELSDFPYETLSQYTKLTQFSLYKNPISSFPIIQSDTMKLLDLSWAAYHTVPEDALGGLPNLEMFRIRGTDVHSLAKGIFTSLPNLGEILMYTTGLTHLKSLQFGVNSIIINKIDLHGNQIATVDSDAFKGVESGTINLSDNQLTILTEATWRPLIVAGVHLQLKGNELTCGCDVAWLVLEPIYHGRLEEAVCHSGELLVDLDPSLYELC